MARELDRKLSSDPEEKVAFDAAEEFSDRRPASELQPIPRHVSGASARKTGNEG